MAHAASTQLIPKAKAIERPDERAHHTTSAAHVIVVTAPIRNRIQAALYRRG
jgi:hypothetical protein